MGPATGCLTACGAAGNQQRMAISPTASMQPVHARARAFSNAIPGLTHRTRQAARPGIRIARHPSSSKGARWRRGDACVTCSLKDTAIGLGVFFTPSILATIYAFYKGKGNLGDGFSRLLTEVHLSLAIRLLGPADSIRLERRSD